MNKRFIYYGLVVLFFIFIISYIPNTSKFINKKVTTVSDPKVVTQAVVADNTSIVTHVATPEPLKGVYMTSCVASMPTLRAKVVKLIDQSELNAVVIDIKDSTGTVSFHTGDKEVDTVSGEGKGCRVSDMKEFLAELHKKNIYIIGRVATFQDPLYTKLHPELAVRSKSTGGVWKDRKGLSFIDVGAKPFWDYIVRVANVSYAIGFDEINFDYIRFPSDGDMSDTNFTLSSGKLKRDALRGFFEHLATSLLGTGPKISADIFGMTTTNFDDLGIGQVLEYALENFDYVSPMVYPSHYPPDFNGWKDPNKVPYDIVHFAMSSAVKRSNLLRGEIASSTPDSTLLKIVKPSQLRPWLQDNNYPVTYTPEMVKAQIKATYDSGLTSWMLWNPGNVYTESALLKT